MKYSDYSTYLNSLKNNKTFNGNCLNTNVCRLGIVNSSTGICIFNPSFFYNCYSKSSF